MSEKILCGPCGYSENNSNAEQWCTVCEEGLCSDCERVHKSIKTTRNHRLISIEDFRQIKDISISLKCKDHDKQLELYCKTHDAAACLGCLPSRHRTCSDVIPLDKAAENAKRSTALADLEDTLTGALQNIEQLITDRESALENFESQKQTVKNSIKDTRARLAKKLDNLEQKLLHEVNTKHENLKSKSNKFLNYIKNSKQDLSCLREQTSQLKLFASDVQLFLGTRQMIEAVFKEVKSVKEGFMFLQNYQIQIQFHPTIMSFMDDIDQLGNMSVKKTTTSQPFKEVKVDQAQIQLGVSDTKSIKNIDLRLKSRFTVKKESDENHLSGCSVFPNGNVLIADFSREGGLMEYSEGGKLIRDVPCSGYPFDLTVIDSERFAISCSNPYIEIFNKKTNTIEGKFKIDSSCYGISYEDNKLFIVNLNGIVIADVAGKVLNTFRIYNCGSYFGIAKDRIYFTDEENKTVHCISMAGDEIWVRKEKSLVSPRGITVDDHQNVFIVDCYSNLLIVIQHDGSSSRTLLSKTDGLVNPLSLHYNKDNKVLVLCDANGCALYNLG